MKVVCAKAIWKTVDRKNYFEQLILKSIKQLILLINQNVGLGY